LNEESDGSPDPAAELELGIKQVAVQQTPDGSYQIILRTTRGDIPGILHACEGGTGAAVFISGASGGVHGPADSVYERLAFKLSDSGVSSLRLDYRMPGEFDECVLDALGGVSFLRGIGAERVVVVGHSFGGAVAIKAGELSETVCAVVAMSSQMFGTNNVERLSPRPLLLVHGMDDQVLEATASELIYQSAAEPKELVLYEGAGHALEHCSDELFELLSGWIPRQMANTSDEQSGGGR
jgi:alpha/beta superfamily hydrolase